MRNIIVAALVLATLAACAAQPSTRALVVRAAPRVSDFTFDAGTPLTAAEAFSPWLTLTATNNAESLALDACIADRDVCETGNLIRYRRLLELAVDLEASEQLDLVQAYFNSVEQILPDGSDWASLYHVTKTHEADCKGIALSKYFTLRRLGWAPQNLRVVMNWDDRERDWHAVLAVRSDNQTYILDSILGLQEPKSYSYGYMVYSISEQGFWDHAPDFVPVP
jgi:predicted transglutaminase-like cysteine proteinase